ncbi:NAD(P)H-quinone oxidoreductase subunit 5 [Muriicola jejuensis]|uniref:Pesticidal protein Cry28Aa n=1 Tax=Muriicola jejuensis TaxID=504488 RepID=A0A6P0UIG8_9FLAO|nr:proton-conducting transporter membrane subunit [Muriicola jejuensis]NER11589.1 pesticidal protein Cry28Aa [Muriicola jejuensis]SMP19499.1 NAD(P)H-quinone oxidoreductase subunit 5 [Muriicola jejuensis]
MNKLKHQERLAGDGIQRQTNSAAIPKGITAFFWVFFLSSLAGLVYFYSGAPQWNYNTLFRVNGFTALICATVAFFSAIVGTYSLRYLKGFRYHNRFMFLCLGFTLSVTALVLSEHLLVFVLSWTAMGLFMARLIGVNRSWGEAREALKFTQRYFLSGSALLGLGIALLAYQSGQNTVSGLMNALVDLPMWTLVLSGLLVIVAAMIQSAIYPFHRWLLSSMTAPTPASALMHAGFVNGSGILLALFSTLIFASHTLDLLFVIGGLTAVIAQFTKLLQVNVKQKLACSTIAQMGFMIMQCGLGFFNAAVAHLILHGFYKAYLFLSSGEEITYSVPQSPPNIRIKPIQAIAVLIFGTLGAGLFIFLTGKGTQADSSIFLTLIVAIAVGQITYNIVKQQILTGVQKILLPSILFVSGIGLYALLYNGVTQLMSDLPLVAVPTPLTALEIGFGLVFLIGFFIMKLGIYRQVPWLYVKLLNLSQPFKKSILTYKS